MLINTKPFQINLHQYLLVFKHFQQSTNTNSASYSDQQMQNCSLLMTLFIFDLLFESLYTKIGLTLANYLAWNLSGFLRKLIQILVNCYKY